MPRPLTIIGAPSSAGAYAPGQEKVPAVLRKLGLLERLREQGAAVEDYGDVAGFRWRTDQANPHAMNAAAVAVVARAVAERVEQAFGRGGTVLMLGGDCTVELGTVAGILACTEDVDLIYIDRDTDMKMPQSTTEGALDWMGVAHLLGVEGAVPELARLGPRAPMLKPSQVFLFAHDNVTPSEAELIASLNVAGVSLEDVAADPTASARAALEWGRRFDQLLIHLDIDVLDFADMPLAENTRRNSGLKFGALMAALGVLLQAPNLAALTVTELNPDHSDDETLSAFVDALARAVVGEPREDTPEQIVR